MRRSICYTEPVIGLAGEKNTWKFVVVPSVGLPKGTLLKFDLVSKGRIIDWEVPQINPKDQSNMIWAEIEDGKTFHPKAIETKGSLIPQFEFVLPVEVPAGKKIHIFLGTPLVGHESEKGNQCQKIVQRRRSFNLYIDPSGKHHYNDPEVFSIDIRGNSLYTIRILVPSIAVKNRRFDVILRFEDRFGNLTNNAPEETLIEISHENLRDNLKWRLFLPETGFIALPNLYFNEIGVYSIMLKNLTTKKEFFSAPIKCFNHDVKTIFWGSLHGESDRYDSQESIEQCLRHFRDEKSLNFFATSLPDPIEQTSIETWKKVAEQVRDFNEDERFCSFLGQQYVGEPKKEGTRLLVFAKDDRPMVRQKETRSSNLKKVYGQFSPKDLISIPAFTQSQDNGFDFADFSPEVERLAEIYNAWGCSERTAKEGNPFPIPGKELTDGSLIRALKRNCRFGFVAGGLDDRSVYFKFFEGDNKQYPPGLTAILCDRISRQAVFEALYNRHTYATTGPRIVVGFSLSGFMMGSEISTEAKPGLHVNRHLAGYVAGTAPLKSVELIRNGEVLQTFHTDTNALDFTYDDLEDLLKACIKAPSDTNKLFAFYYLRATQTDGHMAWSSPIWVDYTPHVAKKHMVKPPAKTKDLKNKKSQAVVQLEETEAEIFEEEDAF